MSTSPSRIPLTTFSVYSLLGDKNYTLKIKHGASIIVGPNGAGKSNFLNILYLVISRQWARLVDYTFDRIAVETIDDRIEFSKDDILEVVSFGGETRFRDLFSYLVEQNGIGAFIAADLASLRSRRVYSDLFKIPSSALQSFQRRLREGFLDADRFLALERFIERLDLGPVIYMPTYRRIEKDLKALLPNDQARHPKPSPLSEVAKIRFIEVISAGMGDVTDLLEENIRSVAVAKQRTTEKAAQEYILDIVRGEIANFSLNRLKDIDEKKLISFVETLDTSIFKKSDKTRLQKQILNLRNKRKAAPPKAEERYLGLYIWKLLQAQVEIDQLEEPLRNLSDLANKYIGPEKTFDFVTSVGFQTAKGGGNIIELNGLSSGEKQLIAMFSYLLLSGEKNYILIVDEPELSLSVPWQKTLLPDILSTGNCQHIFAVTHSPFIFSNELRQALVDTESMSFNDNDVG
jgi:ABC-type lipoprotein export system ATPase subunit